MTIRSKIKKAAKDLRNRKITAVVRWNISHGRSNMCPEILEPIQRTWFAPETPGTSRNILVEARARRQLLEDSMLFR